MVVQKSGSKLSRGEGCCPSASRGMDLGVDLVGRWSKELPRLGRANRRSSKQAAGLDGGGEWGDALDLRRHSRTANIRGSSHSWIEQGRRECSIGDGAGWLCTLFGEGVVEVKVKMKNEVGESELRKEKIRKRHRNRKRLKWIKAVVS